MNKFIFNVIAESLAFIGEKTGLTYNEINIITYYFLIPLSWFFLLDIIFDFHYFKISFAISFIYEINLPARTGFNQYARSFQEY